MSYGRTYHVGVLAGVVIGFVAMSLGGALVYATRDMPETWLWSYIVGLTVMCGLWKSTGYVAPYLESRLEE